MNCYIMKPIVNYFDNVSYLLGTLFSGISTLLSEKTIVNEDFMDKFKDSDDRKKLDETIHKMRKENIEREIITLKNKEEITILVK